MLPISRSATPALRAVHSSLDWIVFIVLLYPVPDGVDELQRTWMLAFRHDPC